tara:strand:+ start:138944 stop:148690 length:9747 start_codon:yes stop_codon:yes gene_type:complete
MAIQEIRQETYSSPLVNYTEPYDIFGIDYTRFYTELNTELKKDDHVYILNGNYDNSTLINQNEYQKGTTGYKILFINKNSIVLDIPYRDEDPFNIDSFEDYTKVYLVDSLNKFNYENIDNGFGFDLFTGEKYSTLNNNIFLSQIENMSYTLETQTNGKFFKSNLLTVGDQIESTDSRGQVIDDSTFLNWELEETTEYGLTPSGTGSSTISFSAGKNFVKDFDLLTNSSLDKMVALTSVNLSSDANLWTWDKKTREIFDVEIHSSDSTQIDAHYMKPFETGFNTLFPDKNNIRIKCPANLDGTYSMSGYVGLTISTSNGADLFEYDVEGLSQTLVLGYSGPTSSNNFRSFGFYNNNGSSSYMVPSIDNGLDINNPKQIVYDYAQTGATHTTPYFVLSNSGTYSSYFPVNTDGSVFNVVPDYAKFSGIGSPVKVEINDWINTNDQSQNLEYCFAGEKVTGSSDDALQGGLYFYSYTGNYENLDTNVKHIGNAIELSQTTLDKYDSGSWSSIPTDTNGLLNPFWNLTYTESQDLINNVKDVKWIGIEKKNFTLSGGLKLDLTTTNNGETVVYPSSNGIYYSKYLVTTSTVSGFTRKINKYYIYLNFNFDLLRLGFKAEGGPIELGMPQVHCFIESIPTASLLTAQTVIGSNRTQDGDIYPYILDGKYALGNVAGGSIDKFEINESFGFDFTDSKVTDFVYNDQRWIVGAGGYSPRITSAVSVGEGLYVYDESVSLSTEQITTGSTFSIGDSLPSNEVFKVRGEVIDGQRRVWASTNNGIFMFDSSLSINEEYYYTIDLDNNEIPIDNDLYKNNRLYIMEDFTYDGIDYKQGDICRWMSEDKRWEIDVTYLQPYLSKAHFEDGSFLPSGILDDAIFGNRDTIANWTGAGAEWRNGILYNSNWLDGTMQSKSDENISQSYYSLTKNTKINNTTDFTNNNTFGYNMSIKSNILGGNIDNGNFEDCIIGDINITGLLDHSFSGTSSFTYSNVTVDKGYFLHTDIYSTIVNDSKIESSNFESSKITDSSRIINTNSLDSIIDDATIENKGKIKITGYDKWYNIKRDLLGIDVIHVHKFFIDEKDFGELEFGNSVIFNNVTTDGKGITDILNNIFYVIGGTSGYYEDMYEDLNKIQPSFTDTIYYTTNRYKLFISKKLKTQNTIKSTIVFNGVDLDIIGVTNENPQYSIDISIVVTNILHNSASELYLNSIKNDGILKFNVLDIASSTIQTDHFEHSWINGGEWINGSIISPNQLSHKFNNGTMSIYDNGGTMSLKLDIMDEIQELKAYDILSLGNNVNIENLWDIGFGTSVGGNFKVTGITVSGSFNSIILEPYDTISLTASTILTQPISQYKFINTNRFDGINNKLIIKSGLFKNQSFSNLEFNDNELVVLYEDINTNRLPDINTNNKKLLVINSEITNANNVIISGGDFVYGQLSSDFGTSSNASGRLNSYKQVFSYFDINSGRIEKSCFLDGNFNNGLFINNKYNKKDDLIPINNTTLLTSQTIILPVWMSGTFNNGKIDRSVWMSGTFNNGKFLNSEFLGGTFNNGIFGDISTKSTLNAFRKGIFENGIFENGIFGDNSNRITKTNSIYGATTSVIPGLEYVKTGTNVWNDGNFNNGIFTAIDNNVSLWFDGNFNNGQVLDSVIWYDGIFNNGKFKSVYGRHLGLVVGEVDLDSISTVSDTTPSSDGYGSRVVNLNTHYAGSLSFLNQYNISTIRDKHRKNKFTNPGTLLLDTYDNQIKYTFISATYSSIISPFDDDNSSQGYGEYQLEQFYGASGSPFNLGLQFKPIDYLDDNINTRNPLYNSKVLGAKIFIQDSGNEFVYDGAQYVTASNFLGMTISNTSLTYSNTYAWRGGVFNNGEFGGAQNYDNTNPSWEDGIFNGGKFYGKIWKNGTFVRGNFEGSGYSQASIDVEDIYRGYEPQKTIENYITNYSTTKLGGYTYSTSQINSKNSLNNWWWSGLWLDGQVLSNINELDSISNRANENSLVEYFKKEKFKRVKPTISNFNNVLWVDGTFNSNDANFNESVWLNGTFNNGKFVNSMFNPYVQRWDFETGDLTNLKFKFELDTDLCKWNNGTFESGVFYYSDWNNGTFNHGTMVGGLFKKGIANYMSAFSTIWEGGRFRNGNWYGSNFTIENVNAKSSVPNPFDYLGSYFTDVTYPPFITDILSNNADRLQDDRLHIWNIIGGTSSNVAFDLTGHDFGTYSYSEPNGYSCVLIERTAGTPTPDPELNIVFRLEDISSVSTHLPNGIFKLEFEVSSNNFTSGTSERTATPIDTSNDLCYSFNMELHDVKTFTPGIYDISFYTDVLSGPGGEIKRWSKFIELDYMEYTVVADIYTDGLPSFDRYTVVTITDDEVDGLSEIINVGENETHKLHIYFSGRKSPASTTATRTVDPVEPTPSINPNDFIAYITMDVALYTNVVEYTENNNTLNGYIEPVYNTNYLDSIISTVSGTLSYTGNANPSETLDYCAYDIATISVLLQGTVSTVFKDINGVYAQYGNGMFLEGIWENGVWNNGYRGTKFGTIIIGSASTLPESDSSIFTYGSGATASVLINSLYKTTPRYQWRTSPTIYFNKVQRSYKVSFNRWRFVLESAFNIQGTSLDNYNKLRIGDLVSIGNIIGIDINGNRKLIKDLFTVVELPTRTSGVGAKNRITLEYKETFPIDDIQIDSDRHLIYVQKNVWLYGSFLNGWFEGVMNGGYIRGNREITELSDSHLIDVRFEGGRLHGSKYTIESAFDSSSGAAQSLSPQFIQKYNNLYHSTVVQSMDFKDDMTHRLYTATLAKNPIIFGSASTGAKIIDYSIDGLTASHVQFLYNSDIDVVYEPEYFSSLYNQLIFNSSIVNEAKIGGYGPGVGTYRTVTNNVPAGYITYDILSSKSTFKYSLNPKKYLPIIYQLNLGSKYKKYNNLVNADFSESTEKSTLIVGSVSVNSRTVDTVANSFNIVNSNDYDINNRWFSTSGNQLDDGITFQLYNSFDIHENFAYIGGTAIGSTFVPTQLFNNSLITANNDFITKNRYHVVEVDVEFPDNIVRLNPYNIDSEYTFNIGYTYSETQLPKLTIGQGYNELYEYKEYGGGQRGGYISPYDNDFIPYFDGRKLSEINGFTASNRLTLKSYMYNNYGGYRDNVKIFQKGFDLDQFPTGTGSGGTVSSPIYYSFKHYEIDQIPFFRYQDFIDPISGTISEWNIFSENGVNYDEKRKVDTRIKSPFYATSVPIQYGDDSFILTENINFFGGIGIDDNLIIDIDIYNIINNTGS